MGGTRGAPGHWISAGPPALLRTTLSPRAHPGDSPTAQREVSRGRHLRPSRPAPPSPPSPPLAVRAAAPGEPGCSHRSGGGAPPVTWPRAVPGDPGTGPGFLPHRPSGGRRPAGHTACPALLAPCGPGAPALLTPRDARTRRQVARRSRRTGFADPCSPPPADCASRSGPPRGLPGLVVRGSRGCPPAGHASPGAGGVRAPYLSDRLVSLPYRGRTAFLKTCFWRRHRVVFSGESGCGFVYFE